MKDKAINMAEGPERERKIVEKVRSVDFAGVKIGQSLEEVFDILLSEGYSQEEATGTNLNVYKKAFRYSVDCRNQRITLSSSKTDANEMAVSVCRVGPLTSRTDWVGMEFSRIDSDGNKYSLVVDFTEINDINRTNALKNARVFEINASVVMKARVDSKYSDTLS